ncbi:Uncharacterised protein [uncultured archaeon]|nr:Uncharacterised protein [uncultured archaeon]
MEAKQQFEELVQESYLKAKKIILEEARKLNPFPTMQMGLWIRETAQPAEDLPGILIYDDGKFWTQNYQIILRPQGLYRFSLHSFERTNNGHVTGMVEALPDSNTQSELDAGYITYGRAALYKINEILKSREQKPTRIRTSR